MYSQPNIYTLSSQLTSLNILVVICEQDDRFLRSFPGQKTRARADTNQTHTQKQRQKIVHTISKGSVESWKYLQSSS